MNIKLLFLALSILLMGQSASAMNNEQAPNAPLRERVAVFFELIMALAPAQREAKVKSVHEFTEKQKRAPKDKQPKRSGKGKHIVHQPR